MRLFFLPMMILGVAAVADVRAEIRPNFAMDSDPELIPPAPVKVFSEKFRPLWLKALARPEADLQRMAAETIAQAHTIGMPKLDEATPELIKIVAAEATHPAARFAAARALIVLQAKDSAAALFAASQRYSADLRQLIEPALASWKFEPIREVWRSRLTDKGTRHRDLMLAIRCAGDSDDVAVVPTLLAITRDLLLAPAVRLAAARSAGRLQGSGLEDDAQRLLKTGSPSILHRLCAAALLDRHRSETAQAALLQLARDVEPSIAAAALGSLNNLDPNLVVPLAEQAMQNDDANVRQRGVDAYVARPTPQRVAVVARLLDDPHPDVRGNVREALFQLARTPELDDPIRQAASAVLNEESWRGQEQAALLLGALDHEPVAGRLVDLLEAQRSEVMIASAWGLRQLAVRDTLPAILDKVARQTEARLKSDVDSGGLDPQVGHLCEALGLMKYAPAEPLLRRYIPKNYPMGEFSRGGAIWALGHLHAGTPDETLATQLIERLTDPNPLPPEMTRVRFASALSLGRMKAKSQAEKMRQFLGVKISATPSALAVRWAIQEITGETLPEAEPPIVSRSGWFLEPLEENVTVPTSP